MGANAARPTATELLLDGESLEDRYEFIGGERFDKGYGTCRHETTKANVIAVVCDYLASHAEVGQLFAESLFVLGEGEEYMPEVSVLRPHQIAPPLPDSHFDFAPALAIEVVFSQRAVHLEKKAANLLRAGTVAVWAVYEPLRMVRVYTPDGQVRTLRGDDLLDCPTLLPGFQVPVSRFFQGL